MGSVDVGDGGGEVSVGVTVGRGRGVFVGIALCVSVSATKAVLAVEMAVSILSAWLIVGVDRKLLQEANSAARNKEIIVLSRIFMFHFPLMFCNKTPKKRAVFQPFGARRERHPAQRDRITEYLLRIIR
jgi:hypothetical protein